MAAILYIVSQVPSEVSMSMVFNESFIGRLATMNKAARALRELGYRVVRQELNPSRGHRPEVQVERDATPSIGPLLDRSKGRMWRTEGGKKRGYTEFQGVTVCWEEA